MDLFTREQGCYRWRGFTLDPVRRSLSCDGVGIKLAERLFDVLLYLVSNHGRLVERDELLQAVWPGRVVADSNVGQAIFELRRVLKAGGGTERSIVTVPGKGFRFTESVAFEVAPPVPATIKPMEVPPPASWWRGHAMLGVALLSLVMAGISLTMLTGRAPAGHPTEAAFEPPPHSVAVLAFDNMSGDPGQDYVSDGLAEQVIDSLTRIEAIQVAGRISSFSFRGGHATVGEIARALNVSAVLAGSYRRSGGHVVVTAQLTNAQTGYNMWSDTFYRDQGDVVTVQSQIARAVVQSINGTLTGGDAEKLTLGGTHNAAAYDLYLRGTQLEHVAADEVHHRAALADFDRALALDPDYARAHAGRAGALCNLAVTYAVGGAAVQHKLLQDALAAADRAVALAPGLGQTHSQRAWVLNVLLDHVGAEREMQQAVALTPGSAAIEGNYANIELAVGHLDRAVDAAQRSIEIDTLSMNTWGQYARVLFMARRFDEAAAALHRVSVVHNGLRPALAGLLGGVLLMQGHTQEAATLCAPAATIDQKEVLAIAYHRLGRQADADAMLASFRADQADAGAFSYAEIYAQWGRKEEAVTWLKTAARLHDPGMSEVGIDPVLDPIRDEQGFKDTVAEPAVATPR